MTERLALAESYYAVARDLERQGKCMLDMAEQLNQHAGRLCEENIRETQADKSSGNEVSK